jgi:hypothetical protein
MTSPAQKLAGRLAVAVLLVVLAAGSALAAAATLPAAGQGPVPARNAEPSDSPGPEASPGAKASRNAGEDEDAAESPDVDPAEEADGADASPSPANLARIVERLAAAGITTTADDLAALAAKVGVGGAVRVLRFADASGKTTAEILALFESGKGWGVIARELDLDTTPGNGSVMGRGNGPDEPSKAADRAARAEAKAARAAERAQQKAGSGD